MEGSQTRRRNLKASNVPHATDAFSQFPGTSYRAAITGSLRGLFQTYARAWPVRYDPEGARFVSGDCSPEASGLSLGTN
jgi:hypothetical protein